MSIHFLTGDATVPQTKGTKIIGAHSLAELNLRQP